MHSVHELARMVVHALVAFHYVPKLWMAPVTSGAFCSYPLPKGAIIGIQCRADFTFASDVVFYVA